jgi:hypothetical protein
LRNPTLSVKVAASRGGRGQQPNPREWPKRQHIQIPCHSLFQEHPMGVSREVAYGILLTDEFGGVLRGKADLFNAVEDPYGSHAWLVWCPSAEDNQLVIGVSARVTKATDFKALHERWEQALKTAPAEIQALAAGHDPDVHFLAGKD